MTIAPPNSSSPSVPPHNLEAEQSVLGAILLSDRTMHALVIEDGLRPPDFYREQHRLIYEAMLSLYSEGEPVDALTVTDRLERTGQLAAAGGEGAVASLAGGVPAAGNIRHYGRIVKEHALLRRLLSTTYEIQSRVLGHDASAQEIVEQAEKAMLEVAHDDRRKSFRRIDDVLGIEIDKLQELSRRGTALTGTPSGFNDLDEVTGGFQPGNLIVIAARPSMGKSALVTNIAENASIEHGAPVALFSLEMSESELAQRFLASQGRIPGEKLRRGKIDERHDWPKVVEASQRLAAAPLYIDDSSDVGILEIRAKARRLHGQHPLKLIIVDYLQLLRAEGRRDANRVEAVGEMSRGLKILARELDVPVIALSQLSRQVEQRPDKRPQLSDLRECVTGETPVQLADGRRIPIRELVGTTPDVVAVDGRDRIVHARSDLIWEVGRRPVLELKLASGRRLRATAKHRLRTAHGWQHLGELHPGDRVALARRTPEPPDCEPWPEDHVVLLGQLVGDGSYLLRQPLRYTTASEENSRAVATAAERGFGATVRRHEGRGSWHQLVISGNGNRWHPAPVAAWLRGLEIFGQRSHEKRLPTAASRLPDEQVALLLRHLWATDGSIFAGRRRDGRRVRRVAYSTTSPGLASDVAALLSRLAIVARIVPGHAAGKRTTHHVLVSGAADQRLFLERVGAFGPRAEQARALAAALEGCTANTNVDTLPRETWNIVRSAMRAGGVSTRAMAARRGTAYGGTSHFRFAPSRPMVASYAEALSNPLLAELADGDLYWDRIVSVEPDGEETVYDLTVPGPSCWLADGIISHNSGQIEQDADLVIFIYRDEYYAAPDEPSDRPGEADLIVAKHRNGRLDTVRLVFVKDYPQFMNYQPPDR